MTDLRPLELRGSPATLWSFDQPGTQGCLREPVEGGVYAVLWECSHAHRSDAKAMECAEKEWARRRKVATDSNSDSA